MWEIVEAKVEKIRIAKTERRGEKGRRRKEIRKKRTEERGEKKEKEKT